MANDLYAAQYVPGPVPSDLPPSAARYLADETQKIAAAISLVTEGNYTVTYTTPAKVQPGVTRFFAASVAPGNLGEGLYLYKSTGWVKVA